MSARKMLLAHMEVEGHEFALGADALNDRGQAIPHARVAATRGIATQRNL